MRRVVSLSILGLIGWLGLCVAPPLTVSVAAQERVRAKVGIQVLSGEQSSAAKTSEQVKKGDFVRVYVIPEEDAYVYVVHNDGKKITLLNAQNAHTKMTRGLTMALPEQSKFYQIDGASDKEAITIICSPHAMPEMTTLFSTADVPSPRWLQIEKGLLEQSQINLGQKTDTPFHMAGNVRSLERDPFIEHLRIYSGKSLMVKRYELQVQK